MVNLVNGRIITIAIADVVLVAGTKRATSNTDVALWADRKSGITFEHLGSHVGSVHQFSTNELAVVVQIGPFEFNSADWKPRKSVTVPVWDDAATFGVEYVDHVTRFSASSEIV